MEWMIGIHIRQADGMSTLKRFRENDGLDDLRGGVMDAFDPRNPSRSKHFASHDGRLIVDFDQPLQMDVTPRSTLVVAYCVAAQLAIVEKPFVDLATSVGAETVLGFSTLDELRMI